MPRSRVLCPTSLRYRLVRPPENGNNISLPRWPERAPARGVDSQGPRPLGRFRFGRAAKGPVSPQSKSQSPLERDPRPDPGEFYRPYPLDPLQFKVIGRPGICKQMACRCAWAGAGKGRHGRLSPLWRCSQPETPCRTPRCLDKLVIATVFSSSIRGDSGPNEGAVDFLSNQWAGGV